MKNKFYATVKSIIVFSLFVIRIYGQSVFLGLGVNGTVPVSHAFGISGDGSVVVGQSQALAFRWTLKDGMVNIGTLPGYQYSNAFASNYDGSIVVGDASLYGFQCGYIWKNKNKIAVNYPFDSTWTTQLYKISDDGSIIVGYSGTDTIRYAFKWQNGDYILLGDLPGGLNYSEANSVSADGSIIVGIGSSDKGGEAFKWSDSSGMIGLGALLENDFFSDATDISADGTTIIGFSIYKSIPDDNSEFASFRWTEEEGMTNLGFASEKSERSYAHAVSSNGNIIVGRESGSAGNIGYIWTKKEGIKSFKTFLEEEHGLDLTGWSLIPYDISNDGKTIVGFGRNPENNDEAWRVVLSDDPVSFEIYNPPIESGFELYKNYPNPFNPQTTIKYKLSKKSKVILKIFDISGKFITTLVNQVQIPGVHEIQFNAHNLSSGIYIYMLEAGSFIKSQKMVLLQ